MERTLAALAVLGTVACGGEVARQESDTTAHSTGDAPSANIDSIAAVQRAESLATALGVWNASEVVSRLEAAGLVVRDLDRPVTAPGFGMNGTTLAVSGGELVVVLYPSARERIAVTAALDSATAAPSGTTTSPWARAPRLITSGNLAAVLLTDREQLAERVRNVLSARHAG